VPRRGTVVLGLGNPVLGDDAAGLRVADTLQQLLQESPVDGVQVAASTRAGFELIDLLTGASRAIIIDCLQVADPHPGRVRRLDLGHVAGSARLVGPHDISVAIAFELAATLGIPMPQEVDIYGIEGAAVLEFTERMTPEVEAAAATLARELHALLRERAAARAVRGS
jgi:hydrogenase maturation protease